MCALNPDDVKKIVEQDGKFLVMDSSGEQVLGETDTKEEALELQKTINAAGKSEGNLTIETKDGKVFVIGPCSTDEVDQGDDVVTKECIADMKDQIDAGNIKLDLDHERWEKSDEPDSHRPFGRAVKCWIDEVEGKTRLMVKWLLNQKHPDFKEKLEEIKEGFYDGFSIAYVVKDFVKDVKDGIRFLKRLILKNVALTAYPMNLGCSAAEVVTKSIHLKHLVVDGVEIHAKKLIEDKRMGGSLPDKDPKDPKEGEGEEPKSEGGEGTESKGQDNTELLKSIQALTQALEAKKELEKKGETPDDTSVAEKLKSVSDAILGMDQFKHVKDDLEKKKQKEEKNDLVEAVKSLTEIVNAPALPPADTMSNQNPDVKTKADEKKAGGTLRHI